MELRARFYTIAIALFIISLIAAVYLTKVFLTTFLFSIFMTYLLYPIYAYLLRLTGNKQISSLITIFSASALILYLVLFVVSRLLAEVSGGISSGGATYIRESNLSQAIEMFMERFLPAPMGLSSRHCPFIYCLFSYRNYEGEYLRVRSQYSCISCSTCAASNLHVLSFY